MVELEYWVVDVFAGAALQGNPLAVVRNQVGLSTERMQAIAREFNLSETTFVERRPAELEAAEGVRVRIFTTQEELNFAGHPTLGTASVLRLTAPEVFVGGAVTLAENVGPIPVQFSGDGLFGEMTQRDPEFGAELNPSEVARLTGLEREDLHPHLPPQVVSTGTAFAIVVLRSEQALARLKVDLDRAAAWLRQCGARWFYVLAAAEKRSGRGPDFRARMQFEGGEDPATGSAAGCAIAYLVRRGAVASGARVHLRQGVEMGRPSDLFLSARTECCTDPEQQRGSCPGEVPRICDVRVAGSTVLVATGRLFLS
jgi:trans-2,3-dihydro-3-hydroxyanthranilate isomerase